jgi:hypothetical protein
MRPFLLFLAAIVLPLVWGWRVYLLLSWLWPVNASSLDARHTEPHQLDPLDDYQI